MSSGYPHPSSRRYLATYLALGALATAGGVIVGVQAHTGFGTWIAGCLVGGWVLTGAALLVSRRTMSRLASSTSPPRLTGRTLHPIPSSAGLALTRSWVGGANVPGVIGRINAGVPLAAFEVYAGGASLRLRPRLVARAFGAVTPLTFSAADAVTAFPVRGPMRARGVGLARPGVPASYLWTAEPEAVLTALAGAGFTVTWDEVRPRIYWPG